MTRRFLFPAIVGGTLALIVAIAIASGSGSSGVATNDEPAAVPDIGVLTPIQAERKAEAEANNDQPGGEINHIAPVGPSDDLLNHCKEVLATDPSDLGCAAEVAKAAGQLKPGDYTDAELRSAIAASSAN
jgi:hypothetical protein